MKQSSPALCFIHLLPARGPPHPAGWRIREEHLIGHYQAEQLCFPLLFCVWGLSGRGPTEACGPIIPSLDGTGGTKSLFVRLGVRVLKEKLTTLAEQQSRSQGNSLRSFCTDLPDRAAICSSIRPLYIPVSSLPIDFVICSL